MNDFNNDEDMKLTDGDINDKLTLIMVALERIEKKIDEAVKR